MQQNVYAPSWRDLVGNSAESFEAPKKWEIEIYLGIPFPSRFIGIKVLGHVLGLRWRKNVDSGWRLRPTEFLSGMIGN